MRDCCFEMALSVSVFAAVTFLTAAKGEGMEYFMASSPDAVQRTVLTDQACNGQDGAPELTLGCVGVPYWVQGAVEEYNRESECTISIVDYWEEDTADALDKMYHDMLAGNGPDIICFECTMVNDGALGGAGMLEDLTAYLNESDVIGPKDFVEPLYEALETDGKRYMLPTNFAVETVVTKEKWAGGEGGWSPEEWLRGAEENKGLAFGMDRENIAGMLDTYGLYRGPEGRRIIETYLKVGKLLPELRVFMGDYTAKRDGKVFMEYAWMSSVEDYLIRKAQWGDDIKYAGVPGAEGSGMALVPINGYGIHSRSEHKEEAWEFIESLFAEERREAVTPDHYFSATKDGLEEQFCEASGRAYCANEGGGLREQPFFADRSEGVRFYGAMEEDIEEIRKVIEEAGLIRREDGAVLDIIREESKAFYAGEKTLEEAAKSMENRIAAVEMSR